MFPVKIWGLNSTRFLELNTRRIFLTASVINCTNRLDDIYIKDTKGLFWQFRLPNNFTRFRQKHPFHRHFKLKLPKVAGFDTHLLHYSYVIPHRSTLLNILADQRETLEELSHFKTLGKGNFLEGLLNVLGDTFSTIERGGEKIFNTVVQDIDKSIDVVTNSSGEIIRSISADIVGFFQNFGIPNMIFFVIHILTIGYILYLRRGIKKLEGPTHILRSPVVNRNIKPPRKEK